MKGAQQAEEITKASKSNLALSFFSLPKQKREDITAFYAFCRQVDDIADESGIPATVRHEQLDLWRDAIMTPQPSEPAFAPLVRDLTARYQIDPNLLREIIEGVRMDVNGTRYERFEDLRLYCWRVASAVGLVSIEIFGYRNPECKEYAVNLGLALQLTNIIRDVGVDYTNGERIYLPLEDLRTFGVTEADLRDKTAGPAFKNLMEFEAKRADDFYRKAVSLLSPEDFRSMVAAEMMRTVYYRLLCQMRADGFRVLEKKYSLSNFKKLTTLASVMFSQWFHRRK